MAVAVPLFGQTPDKPKPEDTEIWEPVPKVVSPGATCGAAPSDAIVLFDGKNLDEWVTNKDKSPAKWDVANGVMTVNKSGGNIETKRSFKNYQLHVEWKVPTTITGTSQARGNSGVFLASTGAGDDGYELQVLDSYQNKTYADGEAGAVYGQFPPLVNVSRPPGQWQTYDIIFHGPRFAADGKVLRPARVTALVNGVLVQDNVSLTGPTDYQARPPYKPHAEKMPLLLQDHDQPVHFRNIWIRELND